MTSHFVASKSRAEATPPEWLGLGMQIAEFVQARADRTDILAYVGEGAGQGAPACFCPSTAEIELNREIAFGPNQKPEWIPDMRERDSLFDHPKAAGALIHEASHARWSVYDLRKHEAYSREAGDTLVSGVIEFFEESRIEYHAAQKWPEDIPFLRTCALEIVLADLNLGKIEEESTPYSLSRLMLLTMARNDAGVLDDSDVSELETLFEKMFTVETYREFRALWLRAQRIDDHEGAFERMVPLAEAWMKLLPEDPDLTEEQKKLVGQMKAAMGAAADSAEIGGADDAADQAESERWDREVAASDSAASQQRKHEQVAEKVFGKSTEDVNQPGTNSTIVKRREPTGEERAAAVTIGRALTRARYRDRIVIERKSELPPGRLKTREAIQGVAQRERGGMVTSQPWETRQRKHVDDPNLTIGVMVDISGSMNGAMVPMAVTAWLMAEAGHRVQANTAMVYYGASAFPTLKPGQRMKDVVIRSAADGVERFTQGFQALDGKLNLLNSTGARLLVICSDMCYIPAEAAAVKKFTDKCIKAGVAVIAMPFDGGYHVGEKNLHPKVQVIPGRMSATDAATLIGQAAVKGLREVSSGR